MMVSDARNSPTSVPAPIFSFYPLLVSKEIHLYKAILAQIMHRNQKTIAIPKKLPPSAGGSKDRYFQYVGKSFRRKAKDKSEKMVHCQFDHVFNGVFGGKFGSL